jgi:hypothetical protein
LNAIETRRIELLGIKVWKGMTEELVFNYTNMWLSRNNLSSMGIIFKNTGSLGLQFGMKQCD